MARILVIDDDRQIRDVMSKWLSLDGHEVATAKNGIDGLELVKTFRFDLLITDIIMPERDGFEVIMSLIKNESRPRIIAMSGGSTGVDKEMLLSLADMMKVDRVLQKPLDYPALSILIREVLQTSSEKSE